MIIYVVVYDMFDGECSYNRIIKAFTKEKDAEEHAALCKAECERINKEVDEYYKKHEDEINILNEAVRQHIYKNGKRKIPKVIDFSELPESIRRLEILTVEREIIKSHKYDADFMSLEDEYCYNIEELELD